MNDPFMNNVERKPRILFVCTVNRPAKAGLRS